jgi:RHS repeat-associated protein
MTAGQQTLQRVGIVTVLGLLWSPTPGRADYDPGAKPSTTARAEVAEGQGLDLATDLVDTDILMDGSGVVVTDTAGISEVTIVDPNGQSKRHSDNGTTFPDWRSWTPTVSGTYHVRVKLDDSGQYYNDPPRTLHFTVVGHALGGKGCGSCGGGAACGLTADVHQSVFLVFSLGTTTDGKSAGALWLEQKTPSSGIISPSSVQYDLKPDDVTVGSRDQYGGFTVTTPQLQTSVVYVNSDKTEVQYYDSTGSTLLRKWILERNAGSPTHDVLVTEYVNGDSDIRVKYAYDCTNETTGRDWRLTTMDSSNATLKIEDVAWTTESQHEGRNVEIRHYTAMAADETETYVENVQYEQYHWGWRQTQQIVDPGSSPHAALTTTWTYLDSNDDGNGLWLASEQRADGSWTWYDRQVNGDVILTEVSGWLTTSYPSQAPSPSASGVHGLRRTCDDGDQYRLTALEEWIDGQVVRGATYSHTNHANGRLASTTAHDWLNTSGSTYLTTITHFLNSSDERIDYIDYPDGRRDDYGYDDDLSYTTGTPPSYNLGGSGSGCHYREVVHGYVSGGSLAKLTDKSTKDVTIVDGAGRVLLSETQVWNGSAWATMVDWTSHEYDENGRPTATYYANGTAQTTSYPDCCSRTETAVDGVQTTYTMDPLGRPDTVVRAAVTGQGYTTQPAITTEYDYSTARQVQVTVSATDGDLGALSQSTIRKYDLAGRLVSTETANGTGDLKTLYIYGTTAQGGQKVTVYSDYPTSATQGTAGTRDRITEYWPDGQVKSVTGSAVVAEYHNYASAAGERSVTVSQVTDVSGTPGADDRYVKTVYDMLGRVKRQERPGWTDSGTATLTTTYYYDGSGNDAGLLKRITRTDAAGTLYQYNELGVAEYTAVDADNDGTFDGSGPDRVTHTEAKYHQLSSNWWRESQTWVRPANNTNEVSLGVQRSRLSGFSGTTIGESVSIDPKNNQTTTTTTLDTTNHLMVETTNVPQSTTDAEQTRHGGRLVKTVRATGVQTMQTYDALGRARIATDGRGNATETHRDAAGRVDWVENEAGNRTSYGYYDDQAAHPGKLYSVQVPDVGQSTNKKTYYDYNDRGQITQVWGDVPYPTLTQYNDYGEQTKLTTYRDTSINFAGSTWPSGVDEYDGDTTTWSLDAATGLMETKTYPATDQGTSQVDYTYTTTGQVYVRTWKREYNSSRITTTYNYADGGTNESYTGELLGITYNDDTPNVTYEYDRLGRLSTVSDAAGSRTLAYDATTLALTTETFGTGSGELFDSMVVTRLYEDGSETNGLPGRYKGVQVGGSYEVNYEYDAVGRMEHVSGPGLPTGVPATYSYLEDTDFVEQILISDGSNEYAKTDRSYEDHRDLVTWVDNWWSDGDMWEPISRYQPAYDDRGRMHHTQRTGSVFMNPSHYEVYGYNERNELTGSEYYTGWYNSGNPQTAKDHTYAYDPIGNRTSYRLGPEQNPTTTYCANGLNQYKTLDDDSSSCPPEGQADETLSYDDDGNLHSVDRAGIYTDWTYEWDAENRLIEARQTTPFYSAFKVQYTYDYLGRRVEAKTYVYTTNWNTLVRHRKFVWDGWKLLAELNGLSSNAVVRKYTWGLDLAGLNGQVNSLEGAGTIGGLLAHEDHAVATTRNLMYFYDANGNVGQLMNLADQTATAWAKYEYDPYGGLRSFYEHSDYSQGSVPVAFAFRFSTKYHDAALIPMTDPGLAYWGYRYYLPSLGRWISRDPIEEARVELSDTRDHPGALILQRPRASDSGAIYGYTGNAPVGLFDPVGLAVLAHEDDCRGHRAPRPDGDMDAYASWEACITHKCPNGYKMMCDEVIFAPNDRSVVGNCAKCEGRCPGLYEHCEQKLRVKLEPVNGRLVQHKFHECYCRIRFDLPPTEPPIIIPPRVVQPPLRIDVSSLGWGFP